MKFVLIHLQRYSTMKVKNLITMTKQCFFFLALCVSFSTTTWTQTIYIDDLPDYVVQNLQSAHHQDDNLTLISNDIPKLPPNEFRLAYQLNFLWDLNMEVWLNRDSITFSYNEDSQDVERTYHSWDGLSWTLRLQEIRTYTPSGEIASIDTYDWENDDWQISQQEIYTYDVDGLIAEYIQQNWNGSAWQNEQKFIYNFETADRLLHLLFQTGDGEGWVNQRQSTHEYNEDGARTKFFIESWIDDMWRPGFQRIYEDFNAANRPLKSVRYNFDSGQNELFLSSQSLYHYEMDIWRTELISQAWSISQEQFNNSFREVNAYNDMWQETEYLGQDWIEQDWLTNFRRATEYNADDLPISVLRQYPDGQGGLANGSLIRYVYEKFQVSQQDISEDVAFDIVPNPATTSVMINTSFTASSPILMSVYHMNGQLVHTEHCDIQDQLELDVSSFMNGVYLIKIEHEEKAYRKKLVVQR